MMAFKKLPEAGHHNDSVIRTSITIYWLVSYTDTTYILYKDAIGSTNARNCLISYECSPLALPEADGQVSCNAPVGIMRLLIAVLVQLFIGNKKRQCKLMRRKE